MTMNIRLRAIIFLVVLTASTACVHKRTHISQKSEVDIPSAPLVDNKGIVSNHVQTIMRLTGLSPATALIDVVKETQKAWLRSPSLEREHLSEQRADVRPLFLKELTSLGMVSRIMPTERHYDYVLLLGAMYRTVKARLSFLEDLAAHGVMFDSIALLGSLRPIDSAQEQSTMAQERWPGKTPTTEIEMMEALFSQSSLATKKPIIIASAMKINKSGQVVRANTLDTVVDFSQLQKKPGRVLVISNQPYIIRQGLVVSSVLKRPWVIETVGPMADPDCATSVYLDELARALFEVSHNLAWLGR